MHDRSNLPAVGPNGDIYFGASYSDTNTILTGKIISLNTNGNIVNSIDNSHEVKGTPSFDSEGNVYILTEADLMHGINPNLNSYLWKAAVPGPSRITPIILANGSIITSSTLFYYFENVAGMNNNGETIYRNTEFKYTYNGVEKGSWTNSSPVVAENQDGSITIYVGTRFEDNDTELYNSTMFALNINETTGEIVKEWSFNVNGEILSSPTFESAYLYFGTSTGYFYAVKTNSLKIANTPWPKYRGDHKNNANFCEHNSCSN